MKCETCGKELGSNPVITNRPHRRFKSVYYCNDWCKDRGEDRIPNVKEKPMPL